MQHLTAPPGAEPAAVALRDSDSFVWHQEVELAPGITSPGHSPIYPMLDWCGVPEDLSGRHLLDVGTSNGVAAFEAVARGATRVVASDIYGPEAFGFDRLRDHFACPVEFWSRSVYEGGDETFDDVLFLGVLYHLRHPLLALDSLWRMTRENLYLETAVWPGESGSALEFYPGGELDADTSNWFAPTLPALAGMLDTSGFEVRTMRAVGHGHRAVVHAQRLPTRAYLDLSYERPLRVLPETAAPS